MPYIDRNIMGKVTGLYACRQYEGQEYLEDNNVEVVAFLAAPEVREMASKMWKSMIRRRSKKLQADNKPMEALLLLKTIGE